MEKATLDDAKMVAFKADKVESNAPKVMSIAPNKGMKFWAALEMAVSW
jgi:hypothetical protein